MTGGRLADPGTADARLEVGFRPDPQLWPADLLAAEACRRGRDLMNPGTDWIEQARRLLDDPAQRRLDAAGGRRTGDARLATAAGARSARCAAVVRGERPEVTAALADVLTATATGAAHLRRGRPGRAGAPRRRRRRTAPEDAGDPPPPVQRIDIA